MHLLYLDDAGSSTHPKEEYLVLGGISVFEAQAYWITKELDDLAATIVQDASTIEFHASEIFGARSHPWRGMRKEERVGVIKAVLNILRKNTNRGVRAFACAVHKSSYPNKDAMELAFEDLCSRFDIFLNRERDTGERQRGILILDESAYETTLHRMTREFRTLGTQWGVVKNLAETPLFVNSKVSRIIQLADHIAYAVFRRYNAHDAQYFDIISSRFDTVGNVVHGLSHKHHLDTQCMCIACISRRT